MIWLVVIGTEWRAFNTGLSDLAIKGFGKTGDTLFAGTALGLFKTNTASAQWTNVPFSPTGNPGVIKMIVDKAIIKKRLKQEVEMASQI